jgi:hypothetical protein
VDCLDHVFDYDDGCYTGDDLRDLDAFMGYDLAKESTSGVKRSVECNGYLGKAWAPQKLPMPNAKITLGI